VNARPALPRPRVPPSPQGLSALSRVLSCGTPGGVLEEHDRALGEVAVRLLAAGARPDETVDFRSVRRRRATRDTPEGGAGGGGAWPVTDGRATDAHVFMGVSRERCPLLARVMQNLVGAAAARARRTSSDAPAAGSRRN
jgi:hypothetical protein